MAVLALQHGSPKPQAGTSWDMNQKRKLCFLDFHHSCLRQSLFSSTMGGSRTILTVHDIHQCKLPFTLVHNERTGVLKQLSESVEKLVSKQKDFSSQHLATFGCGWGVFLFPFWGGGYFCCDQVNGWVDVKTRSSCDITFFQ